MLSKVNDRVVSRLSKFVDKKNYNRYQISYAKDMSLTEAISVHSNPNNLYSYMHHYFCHLCPKNIKEHRTYFSKNQRGFGEDALHTMWWLLMREFKPQLCLEIGVYRGQVISLWTLLGQMLGFTPSIHGISPFTSAGDQVSKYTQDIDYLSDTILGFKKFNLPSPTLIKALSTEKLAIEHISNHSWDLIYIDGSHDYEIVLQDYQLCKKHLSSGGLLVIDDSSLYTMYQPPSFSFAGHPGPSKVVNEFTKKEMKFIGAVGHNNIFTSL